MEHEKLELVEPSVEYEEDFLAMTGEYRHAGEGWEQAGFEEAARDFSAYVRTLQDHARGVGLPRGYVPATTYWLVRNGTTIVATSNLRHRLTPGLEHEGGHIGYGTRPSQRRKGYGTLICALTLQKARQMGIRRVLITCDTDNAASARIIEKNGGKLANRVISRQTGKRKNRYWIDL